MRDYYSVAAITIQAEKLSASLIYFEIIWLNLNSFEITMLSSYSTGAYNCIILNYIFKKKSRIRNEKLTCFRRFKQLWSKFLLKY